MAYESVVEIKELVKLNVGGHPVVDGLSLEIRRGECFGLLGPNGAGKSTTLRMMDGSSRLSGGEMYILGLNVKEHIREIKARIGVVRSEQDDALDPDFTVLENLLVFARFQGMNSLQAQGRAEELLKLLKLDDSAERSIDTLSAGMKRRLAIARGLLHNPELLLIDEPTTGLDPQARLWMWEFVRDLKRQNASIILATSSMDEAEQLCDRLAVLDGGKVLAVGTPLELIREHIGREVVELGVKNGDVSYYADRLRSRGYEFQISGGIITVLIKDGRDSRQVIELISSDRTTIRRPTLNDVFVKMTGHELKDLA